MDNGPMMSFPQYAILCALTHRGPGNRYSCFNFRKAQYVIVYVICEQLSNITHNT